MTVETPPSVRPGDVVGGKYRVERVLGAGGMGCVVVARHVRFDDRVALKVLHEDIAEKPEVVERFLREGRAARQIRSEHVVQVTDVDVLANGAPYLVMEYLDGSDLAHVLKKRGPLPVETVVDWVLQASEALAEAHTRGIVHRDLKPANLFLTKRSDGSNCVKVLDFGISKLGGPQQAQNLTQTSSMVGTPIYMSPEQLRVAKDVDARADIWSLGVILFELLAGEPPFKADTLAALALQIALDDPPSVRDARPDVPEELALVIAKCLAKERDARYANIGEVAMALAPFAPPRARISVDRIARVTGLAPRSTAPPPSLDAPVKVPSLDVGGFDHPTVIADSQDKGKPISLDLEPSASKRASVDPIRPPPSDQPRSASTIGGFTHTSPESSSRAPWVAGAALIVLSLAALMIFLVGRDNQPKPAALPPPAVTATATASASAEPVVTAAPPPPPEVKPSASASASAHNPQKPWIKIKPTDTIAKPPPAASAKPPPPPGKSNEDY